MRRQLFEVKEGPAQFSDIFKVLGWMAYLGIDRGAFVTAAAPTDRPAEFFASRCAQVGMQFLAIPDLAHAAEVFEEAGFGSADATQHAFWRYSLWVERNLMQGLRQFAREHSSMTAPREALNYYKLINDGIFFAADAVERVRLLYDAYQAHPG